ncbi:MAG: RecX family transcriptional regulator [Bacteroidales bacterium]|nr:RecX family transcriptional regulator [Bacteroidales bacterium]
MPYDKALERISRICSRQEKCSHDVKEKLQSWGVKEADILKILQWLQERQFVDDGRYARAYVRDRHHFRKWGKIRIRMMLRKKKIPDELIDKAMERLDEKEYRETLRKELQRKRKTLNPKNRYDLMARLQRFAWSRGYEAEVVREVLEEVMEGERDG